MAPAGESLTSGRVAAWCSDGYVVVPGVVSVDACAALLERLVGHGERWMAGTPAGEWAERGDDLDLDAVPGPGRPAHEDRVLAEVGALLGVHARVVGRRLVLQQPGDDGEHWHQDAAPLPRAPAHHQVGVELALTEATLATGCTWVVPGSHREPVHEHRPDPRPGRQGAVELAAPDPERRVPVPLVPGDLLVVDSHLTHRSTDNHSTDVRVGLVWHCGPSPAAAGGT